MPPLLTLERFLFRLVAVGFVLLTLTLASGIVFSEQLFGKPLTFTHKNVFSVLGWLDVRRAARSAVGATAGAGAPRCAGSSPARCCSLLGYLGSKFVLEVLLRR